MPVGTTLAVATEGAAFGLFPIIWIIWNAIWIYNMTVETGHFAVLRRSFATISDDQRIQAVIIAFCFGALLEALAGFGTPVAITAVMLIAVGFKPMKAAAVALVANTAPVAFGAIAIPIVTLAGLTEIPKEDLGAMVGRQTPLLALFVPLILVGMVDGRRGVRAVWPAAMVGGFTFAVGQFVCVELHLGRADRHRRVAAVGGRDGRRSCASGSPATRCSVEGDGARPARDRRRGGRTTPRTRRPCAAARAPARTRARDIFEAYAPYLIIIVVFALAQWGPIKDFLAKGAAEFTWPGTGRHPRPPSGEAPTATTFKFGWLAAAGHAAAGHAACITMAVLRVSPARARCSAYGAMLNQLKWATLTVMAVLALAYVMNLSRADAARSAAGSPAPAASSRSCRRSSAGSAWR